MAFTLPPGKKFGSGNNPVQVSDTNPQGQVAQVETKKAKQKSIFETILQLDKLTNSYTASHPVASKSATEKMSPETLKGLLKSYEPEHKRAFQKVLDKAKVFIHKDFQKNGVTGNEAVIFDIDETTLDNRPYYHKYGDYNKEDWNKWVAEERALPAIPTVELIKYAKSKGYKVIFITGRREFQKQQTINNLNKFGIPFDEIYCKPDDYNKDSASYFKESTREMLTNGKGYRIVANIGDQKSDMSAKVKSFRLPNPIYDIP